MYIVIETQTANGATAVVTPEVYADRNEAESKFHTVLAAAAVSNVEVHACTVLNEYGVAVLNGAYHHNPAPASGEDGDEA